MKVNKKLIIYIIAMICLIVLIIFSNRIIYNIMKTDISLYNVDFDDYNSECNLIHHLTYDDSLDDVTKTFILSGWAFCEDESLYDDKQIGIIFHNEHNTYLSLNDVGYRQDVLGVHFEYNISNYTGIDTVFPTFNMKNGIYEGYVYVKGNTDIEGLEWFGTFEKNEHGLQIFQPDQTKNISDVKTSDKLKVSIDDTSKDGIVSGWAVLEDKEAIEYRTYIQIVDNNKKYTYEVSRVERYDVVDYFENIDYLNSGFTAEIDDDINLSSAIINVIVYDVKSREYFISSDFRL